MAGEGIRKPDLAKLVCVGCAYMKTRSMNIILFICVASLFLDTGLAEETANTPQEMKVQRVHVLGDEYVRNGTFGLRGLWLGGERKRREKLLPLIKRAGVEWHRSVLFWYQVEPQNDKFDFSSYDTLYDQLRKQDIEIVFTLRSVSPWGAKKSKLAVRVKGEHDATRAVCHMPDHMGDYIDFVRRTASHFKGRIRFWQIENEPTSPEKWSFWGGTAEELVELTKAAYKTIKEVDPRAQVLLSGFTTRSLLRGGVELEFIDAMFRKGVGEYFDIFDIHSYRRPQRVFKTAKAARDILERYGYTGKKKKPIWMTETSTPGVDPLFPLTEQANDVVKRFTLAFSAGISRVFWWNTIDSAKAPARSEKERSRYFGLLSVEGRPKPAWRMYKLMTQKLKGFRKVEKPDTGQGVFVFKYSWDNGSSLHVAWTNKKSRVRLTSQKDMVRVTYQNGVVREIKVEAGQFAIDLCRAPVFIQ